MVSTGPWPCYHWHSRFSLRLRFLAIDTKIALPHTTAIISRPYEPSRLIRHFMSDGLAMHSSYLSWSRVEFNAITVPFRFHSEADKTWSTQIHGTRNTAVYTEQGSKIKGIESSLPTSWHAWWGRQRPFNPRHRPSRRTCKTR